MAIKIKTVSEAVEDNGIKMLVHGPAGVGKTVLCATAKMKTLIVSAEAGLLSIASAPKYIEVVEIKSIDELEEVYDYLTEEAEGEYELVCLDSVSEIAEVLLAEEKAKNKDARQSYGNLSERMTKIMRMFRDLPNINVLFTCKQKRQEDSDTGVVSFVPSLPGAALTQSISYLFDQVFALRVEQDVDEDGVKFDYRIMQCDRDRKYEAKDRSGNLDQFEEPNLSQILLKIRGGDVEQKIEEAERDIGSESDEYYSDDELDKLNSSETEENDGQNSDQPSDQVDETADHVETTEAETPDDEAQEDHEIELASKKLYWIHEDSESCGVIEKGEEYKPEKYQQNGAEFVTLGKYKKFLAENPQD